MTYDNDIANDIQDLPSYVIMLSLLALSIDRYQVLVLVHLIFLAKYRGVLHLLGRLKIIDQYKTWLVENMNLAVDRFYQAEPELRQGKGELFLWEG